MKLSFYCTLTVGLIFSLYGRVSADVLGVTHADFSTVAQGTNGFFYGYYDGPDSTTHAFLSGTGQMQAGMDGPRPVWYATGSGTNLPNMVSFMQHPGPSWEGLKPAVRRYVVGSSGEPSFTGSVRVVGRFYDLNGGSTNVFVAVDLDGDGGSAPRELIQASTPLNGPAPVSFDFNATVAPGTTIDFGVLSNGDFNSDATGLVAWIVTEDSAVPTNVVATSYNSLQFSTGSGAQDSRGLAVALVTDGVVSGSDIGSFDTVPGTTYTHAGLLYSENSGSGKVTRFNSMRIDVTSGADFAELPQLFLLRHNSDPGSLNPAQDERYVRLPVPAVRVAANSAGQPYYTFDLTSLPESQRTGYGFAVFGRGGYSGGAIAVSEISADAVRVSDAAHAPAFPTFIENNGHRYALTFTRGTWEQCQAEAVSYGGNLVSINSAEENEWVFDTFGRGPVTYIGLRQNPLQSNVEPSGGWTWMDGTVLSDSSGNYVPSVYKKWNDASVGGSEPTNSGPGEDYAVFAPEYFSGRSTWGDVKNTGFPENGTYRGIIELPNVNNAPGVRNHQLSVSGQANIFGAGQNDPTPTVAVGSGGVAAPSIPVLGGQKVVLTAAGGTINSGASGASSVPPDGERHPTRRCDISGVGGVSGYLNRNNSAHLVGVFVADTSLLLTPGRIDFSADAIGEGFEVIGPKLGQVFFIGDGLTPGGKVQEFLAPEGATKLYLGIPDAYSGDNTYVYTGPPNGYSDNGGFYNIRLAVQPNDTARFNTPTFPGTGSSFSLLGGVAPFDPITVSSGDLPPGFSINDKTVVGRASEEGQYAFTLRSEDTLAAEATKTYSLNIPGAPKNLVAWWKGDTGAEDSAGNNHGTFTGVTATTGAGSVVGSGSFSFGGSHLVTVPHAEALNLLGDFTIEGWVKRDSSNGLEATIISKRNSDNLVASYVLYLLTDGRLSFASRSASNPGDGWAITTATYKLPADSTWRHLAVTCSGTTMRFFVNGILAHTGTHPSRAATTAPLTIGGYSLGGNNSGDWPGRIDELSLYSRALKSSEINSIVNAEGLGKVIRVKPSIVDEDFLFRGGQLAIEGGTGPYSVTVMNGTLPAGIEISETGKVTGRAANGAYAFTLSVVDANLRFSDRIFSGNLQLPLPTPAGLAAWWPGQNTVAEIVGGDHLAVAPSSSFGYGPGKVGRAFYFDGTSQSLQTATTDVMKHLPLTIEAWIKPEARTTGTLVPYLPTNVIANDRRNFGGHGFGAHLYPDGSMLRVGIEGATEDFRTVPGVTFTDNTWVHVVVVYTEGNVKTYLDGVKVDDYSFTQGALNGGDIIRVGRHNDDTGFGSLRFFKGAIDEVSLYHAALSSAQAGALFQVGALGKERYDAGLDFIQSSPQDEGNRWTYGSFPGSIDPSAFALSETFGTASNGIAYWAPSGGGVTAVNLTGTLIKEWGAGGYWIHTLPQQIRQHPGGGRPNVMRWKAPAAGRYAVSGSFTGLDEYGVNTSVYVYHKSLPLVQLNGQAASASLANEFAGNGHSFTGVIDAQAGNAVDFIVSGDASFDSTGTFASVVYLGPSLEAPSTLTIETQSPPMTERVWTFQTQRANDFQGLALRVQYAEANTPNDWQDIDTGDDTNMMLEPEQGDDTWTLFVPFLDLPAAGNYRFRVVASAAGYADIAGPAFGEEALGETGTDPIAISVPGAPPPPPPLQSMPAVTKMTYSIGGKASVTTAKQGQVGRFMITQSHPPGTPKPTIKVQWTTTPANEQSWQNVESQVAIYSGAVKNVSTASITTPELPSGSGIYFRTLTTGTSRLATPGPVVTNVVKPIGPINITPGPVWEYVSVTASSTSDTTGKTAKVGDVIRYEITFKNDGDAPATDVLVTLPVPPGTVLRGGESAHRSTVITDTTNMSTIKELKWFIPTVGIADPIEKYMTVTVTDPTKLSAITLKGSSIGLKSDELGTALNSSGNPWVFQKDMVTTLFSGLRLTLEGSDAEDDGDRVGIAKMGQVIYYSLKAENRGGSQITNATASLSIPVGMTLEYLRLPGTSGDFTDSILTTPSPSSNPSLTAYVYKKQQLITWNLGTVPGNTTREMKFALRVMFDLESTRFENGAYVTNSVSIDDYNFTAKSGKTTLKAFASKGPRITALLTDEWYATRAPNLVLTKTACADGQASGSLSPAVERLPNGQLNPQLLTTNIPGIGVAAAPYRNTRITYTLNWANKYYPPPPVGQSPPDNRLPETARNAIIREEIPANTTFVGFLRLNDAPAPSSSPFTFRTRDLFAIPSGGEPFIDKATLDNFGVPRFNGRRDTNETYTDTNGNKRYDAFTDTRFIEYRIGSLAAGASGKLTYDVIATGLEGNSIVSRAEGAIIPPPAGGVLYQGYSIWCENRYQAGTVTPEKLVGMISRPVRIEPPVITAGNQRDLQPAQGENVRLEIGYKVSGVSNATLQDYLLTITVPKPLTVVSNGRTGMVNSSLPIGSNLRSLRGYHPDQNNPFRRGESAPTITNRTNDTLVVFKLGGLIGGQTGAVGLELQMPANLPKSLFDAEGYLLVKSYDIKAEMSHATVGTTIVRPASGMIIVEPALRAGSSFRAASGTPLIGDLLKPTTRMFLGRTYPLSVRADGSTFDMIIFFGNATDTYMQGGKITMNIPPGLTLKSQTPVVYYYTGATPAQDNLFERNNFATLSNGTFAIETLDMGPRDMAAVLLTFEVSKSIQGNTIEDGSLSVTTQNASTKTATRMSIAIQRDNWFGNIFNAVLGPLFNGMSEAVANLLRPANERLITVNSRTISIVNADFVHLLNGSVIIPLKGGRAAAIGPPSNVLAGVGCILQDDGGIRIAAAHQSVSGFKIAGISTAFGANQTWSPSAILEGLGSTGFANLVAAGGGNLVAAGGGNLIGLDGSTLINNNTGLIGGAIAFRGPTMVAAGGGNMVAAGGGNIVAAGGGNLIGNDGSTLIGLDGSTLIGLDGSTFKLGTTNLVAAGGGNLVAAGGGNLVAAGGGNMVAAGGMNFSAAAASSSLQSAAAGIATSRLAGAGIIQDLSRINMQGILSHNGGQILSHNGGVLISP